LDWLYVSPPEMQLTCRWDKDLFPDHVAFLKDLHDRKLKVTLNTHPADGVRSFEKPYNEMCKALDRDPANGTVSRSTLFCQVKLTTSPFRSKRRTRSSSRRTSRSSIIRSKMKESISGGSTGNRVPTPKPPVSTRCGCSTTITTSTRDGKERGGSHSHDTLDPAAIAIRLGSQG
jgi:hypothetical protein